MSEKRHAVKVTIFNDEFTVRSDETPEHTTAVAAYVDAAIRQVLDASPTIEIQKAAILAALQITDTLFKVRQAHDAVEGDMEALATEVRRWLPPAKRGESGEQAAIS